MVSKIRKTLWVIQREIINKYAYFFVDTYVRKHTKHLKKIGTLFTGPEKRIKYIAPSVYFDGTNYELIHIGDNVTISMEVMILCHDYTLTTAFSTTGRRIERHEGEPNFRKPVKIGNNCFIGARASLLPGTVIGDNCIIGACAVVKGTIPEGSIVIGNPARIIGKTEEYAKKHIDLGDYQIEEP